MLSSYQFTTFDVPGTNYTEAHGINDSGQIVGTYENAPVRDHGFWFNHGSYTTLDVPGSDPIGTSANGINGSGQIVGNYHALAPSGNNGFLFDHGSYTTLDVSPPYFTFVNGINASGQIVGSYFDAAGGPLHGFLYDHGGYSTLDVPGAVPPWATFANGINASGQIVGYYTGNGGIYKGFLLNNGSYTSVDVPGSKGTNPYGINDLGQIAGYYWDGSRGHGFLFDRGSYTTLDPPASTYTEVFGINNLGQIVGWYEDRARTGRHGFLATPTAEHPTVTPPSNQNAVPGTAQSFALGSFTDPAGGPWNVDVNWGDNTPHTTIQTTSPGSLGSQSHTYAQPGNETVTVTVTNTTDGLSGSGTFQVNVSSATDLVPTIDNTALPNCPIYPNQKIFVSLTVSNTGAAALGNINIEYYLSTSSDPSVDSPGDYLLKTDSNYPINIPAGGQLTLSPPSTVVVPQFIVTEPNPDDPTGAYYLKLRIAAADVDPVVESNTDNNIAVSQGLKASGSMTGHRAAVYESAVRQAKTEHPIDTGSIEDFIKNNEEPGGVPALHVYNDRGNAAIGWGFDLENNGVPREDVRQLIADSGLLNYDGDPLTLDDLLRRDSNGRLNPNGDLDQPGGLALVDKLFSLAYNQAVGDATTAFPAVFQDQTYFSQQKALVDLAYNVGKGGLAKFANLKADVNAKDFACAGFELVDSLRTDQVQPSSTDRGRVTSDFLLLVAGFEDKLYPV